MGEQGTRLYAKSRWGHHRTCRVRASSALAPAPQLWRTRHCCAGANVPSQAKWATCTRADGGVYATLRLARNFSSETSDSNSLRLVRFNPRSRLRADRALREHFFHGGPIRLDPSAVMTAIAVRRMPI